MNKSLRKITLLFFAIALVPVGFLIYELNSLNNNEKIIREIYENQLDAILFSVNQYADDVTNSWANKINVSLMNSPDSALRNSDINSLYGVYFSSKDGPDALVKFARYDGDSLEFVGQLKQLKSLFDGRITKLDSYLQAGFRKMEPLDTMLFERYMPVLFVLDPEVKRYKSAIMLFDIPAFIQNNLGPKMQSIAQEKFEISVHKAGTGDLIYSTTQVNPDPGSGVKEEEGFSKRLSLLPGYFLSISLKDVTINDLVKERMKTSLIILVLLLIVLMGGMIFLYRNIVAQIRLSQAKTEFVSNVSHEIRTPLSLISMYAETLEMNRVNEERKQEYYSIISSETARLTAIVNRILNFSKMDANKKAYTMRAEDVNELCERVLKSFAHHFERNGFKVEFIQDKAIPLVELDHESISEALINLLDNAMKYSDKAKFISVRTASDGQRVFIEVKDQGIGIPKAYQKDIFEQFYRAPMGNVHNTKGSGLGLSLVKKTMIAHRGGVTVDSALDKGSTFRLIFFHTLSKA